jgi:HrpA-like RNA helicase
LLLSTQPFDSSANAILIFLPGIKEITTLQEQLVYSLRSQEERDWVLPIHSTVPPEDQRRVFTRPPPGVRKIVLATNIAETAITIDDVAFVIDTGRMKENRYDPLRRMASLDDCLVSRANARQRRGRAGRVREGVAVHLFTKHRHDYIAVPHQLPEVKRVPLEQLVLRIKALKYEGTAAQVCARLVEPPAPASVNRAVQELTFLEALDENENLTALGVHLSTLPCDCRIGKLILLGAMFGVADEVRMRRVKLFRRTVDTYARY